MIAGLAPSAFGWQLFLQRDLGIKNNMRHCLYSDGKVYTFNATELCEMSIEGSAPGMGRGTGFLKGEYQDGMTKVCVYDVLGETKAIRIGGVALCPLTSNF
jgi:hypothetical protein